MTIGYELWKFSQLISNPMTMESASPAHDVGGGRLNNLNEIHVQQAHFGHYYNVYRRHQKIMSHILSKEITWSATQDLNVLIVAMIL